MPLLTILAVFIRLDVSFLGLARVRRNRIEASRMKRMTARDALDRHPSSLQSAIFIDRLQSVFRTRRIEPASRRLQGRYELAV